MQRIIPVTEPLADLNVPANIIPANMIAPDVLFVGAGPVGLMTAIQAKLDHPKLKILMLEKHYPEYQRKHPLQLDQNSFKDTHPDPAFQELLSSLPDSIRTNELEDKLLAFARGIGIAIEKKEVGNCKELPKQYPSAKIIVGADGSHSKVHEQIFNHEYQMKKTMQYIAEVKYEVVGKTRYLNVLKEAVPATTYAKHYVSEYFGKEKDGITPVAIRIFTDAETYESMKAATFRSPFTFAEPNKIHPSILRSGLAWMKARETLADEIRVPKSERVTVTNLPIYASTEFVKDEDGVTWFLVGDAAFGVPYFRSLNNGILCSAQLANVINGVFTEQRLMEINNFKFASIPKFLQPPKAYYTSYVQGLVNRELLVAEVKNFGVNMLGSSAYTSQSIPVSRMSLMKTNAGINYKNQMAEMTKDDIEEESSSPLSKLSSFTSWSAKSQVSDSDSEQEQTRGCALM